MMMMEKEGGREDEDDDDGEGRRKRMKMMMMEKEKGPLVGVRRLRHTPPVAQLHLPLPGG